MVTVGLGVTLVCTIRYDVVETHCYVVISGEWILMSIYVRTYVADVICMQCHLMQDVSAM